MDVKTDEASLRADADHIDGIDLYDDLVAFTNLSPEERMKGSAGRFINDPGPAPQAAEQFVYTGLVRSDEPGLEPSGEREDRSFELVGQSPLDQVDQPVSYPAEGSPAHSSQDSSFDSPSKPGVEHER